MRPTVFRILSFTSIMMLAVTLALFVFSCFAGLIFSRDHGPFSEAVGFVDGWLVTAKVRPLDQDTDSDPNRPVSWSCGDISLSYFTEDDPNMTMVRYPGFLCSYFGDSPIAGNRATFVLIHFGWLMVLFSLLPLYGLFTRRRATRRRAKLGLCVKCGYDLRGGGGACPECGTPVAAVRKPDALPSSGR